MSRQIIFYRKENNDCPVEEFLDSVPENFQVKIISVTKLFEIRVEWQSNIYRFPCFFQKNKIVVLTHGFQKKTMKTPRKEIEKAENYRKDYLRRFK